jgi:hypothetical protein
MSRVRHCDAVVTVRLRVSVTPLTYVCGSPTRSPTGKCPYHRPRPTPRRNP